jgi:hypothetical protein
MLRRIAQPSRKRASMSFLKFLYGMDNRVKTVGSEMIGQDREQHKQFFRRYRIRSMSQIREDPEQFKC